MFRYAPSSSVGLSNSLESRLHVMEMRMLQEESNLQQKMEMGIGTSRKELLLYASLVKDYREAAAKLQTELTKLVIKKEALIQECFIAKEQVDRFRNIYTELLVKTENEKCEINYLTLRKAAYAADLNKLKQEVKKFVGDNADLASVSSKLDKEAENLSVKKADLLESIDVAKYDVQTLKEELQLLSNEYDSCKRERDDQVSSMLLHIQNIQLKEKGRMDDVEEILGGVETLSAISGKAGTKGEGGGFVGRLVQCPNERTRRGWGSTKGSLVSD
ncbi:hypothetical protein GNI_022810 [Gregarina niphandrodes]|uniref:Uncharacterized protein n=1 Tax=Gregarina niphandrodes TaxID=110365 RepID=A0A023BBM7_GRENI|nr:hypothetical protein GNI_022810 [Gregarina niphandrodes]EZG80089.1 hypothetical protein GNI_022810 [Gregarina niphandrodes]|eukprot:XP_011134338.1 hypothetical protein GNI_022810 [Gregarina niphandrodes]